MASEQNSELANLAEIRNLMQKSSRFISLSGFSGIFAGIFALFGAFAAYWKMGMSWSVPVNRRYYEIQDDKFIDDFIRFCLYDAVFVLVGAFSFAIFFTIRKTRKTGQSIWDATAKRLLWHLALPLLTGGVFCLALLYHQVYVFVAPAMLIFYGLSLLNAAKFTLHNINYLGYIQIVLGLIACFYIGYGLLFWAIGFGVFHILYGIFMYFKYERVY